MHKSRKFFIVTTLLQLQVVDCEDEESTVYVETLRPSDQNHPVEPTAIEILADKDKRNDETFSPQPTKAFKVFAKSLKFLALFGILIGTDMNYKWKSNLRFFSVYILICLFWLLIFYTQAMHLYNNESKRTLEQFAMYGTASSVIHF